MSLFCYCIKHLLDYNEEYYQVWKNETAAKAIISFTLILFLIRKVKLFNWQSILATIVMAIIAVERHHSLIDSPDIFNAVKFQIIAEWLTLLIIIDMFIYKNINYLFSKTNYLLIVYAFFTLGALYRRHDQMGPIVLVFPMFLFALIKMDEEKSKWFMHRFIDGWLLSYIYVCIRSFKENPYNGEQYYGYFQMPGPFSIFVICCLTVAIVSLIYSKNEYGLKSIFFIISLLWIISCIFMIWIIGTRTSFVGVAFCAISMFLFCRQNITKKKLLHRSIFLIVIFSLLVAFTISLPAICAKIPPEWVEDNKIGPLAPLANNIYKIQWATITSEGFTIKQTIYRYIDIFSSIRLTILLNYIPYFNFDGNGPLGIMIEDYYAYSAHNTYAQYLIEYGYITFIELIVIVIMSVVTSTKKYMRRGQNWVDLLPMLWFSSMLGVWFGESETFFYPITFFGFMFIARLIPLNDNILNEQ